MDKDIERYIMQIKEVKGVEIGNGLEDERIKGEENEDEMRMGNEGKKIFI